MQKGFTVDLNRCTGCQACMLACSIENELPINAGWRDVLTFNEQNRGEVPVFHLSLACNHCEDPACMRGCPSLAYSKDPVTGAVSLDAERCIGCRYCMWMCPYDAPQFSAETGTVHKCTFCNDRLHQGREPACVAYCPTSALGIQDVNGQVSHTTIPGFPSSDIKPAIEFVPLRTQVPATNPLHSGSATLDTPKTGYERKVSLRGEWTLLIFTMIAPVLVAWFGSSLIRGTSIHPTSYVGMGLVAMGLSTLHLGRKSRAYRAILNWRHSWLSREIIFFSSFLALSSASVLGLSWGNSAIPPAVPVAAVLCGVAVLFSMDMVYHVAATVRPCWRHSAGVVLTGLFFSGLLAGLGWLAIVAGVAKLILYVWRKAYPSTVKRHRIMYLVGVIRLALGLMIPLLFWSHDGSHIALWVFACCAVAEAIDRAEFYHELDIVTPKRQMMIDLRSQLR